MIFLNMDYNLKTKSLEECYSKLMASHTRLSRHIERVDNYSFKMA